MRGARCLALPHVPPARCVSIVELTSCVGHERQEGDHGRSAPPKGCASAVSRRPRGDGLHLALLPSRRPLSRTLT